MRYKVAASACMRALMAVIAVAIGISGFCLSPDKDIIPTVVDGLVINYPIALREMKLTGAVELLVETDGELVSGVQVLHCDYHLLAVESERIVRTWKFKKHNPTKFITKLIYNLSDDEDKYHADNGIKCLNIPLEQSIVAKRQILTDAPTNATKSIIDWETIPPVVIASNVPIYPDVASRSGVQGRVRLRVSIEKTSGGFLVKNIKVIDGKESSLVNAAMLNIKTWKFFSHAEKSSFDVEYLYVLSDSPNLCKSTLRLPGRVEIVAQRPVAKSY